MILTRCVTGFALYLGLSRFGARINIFDRYRYREDYEAIYNFIKEMGREIKDD
jgi:hypothetical protein